MFKWFSNNKVFLLVIICFISRIPLLLSDNLLLDGDESIVGLMAKHFIEGKEIPLFFYGQTYGFSFIEVNFISAFYFVFGITDIAVKLAMLSLWTIGIVFFYKTLTHADSNKNQWIPFLFIVAFILSPTWGIWSMKARGGYLTAFTLTFIVTYLISNKKWVNSTLLLLFIGFLVVIIYQSQPLWLAGLLPILGYHLFKLKNWGKSISLLVGIVLCSVLFYYLKLSYTSYWSPQIISLNHISLESFTSIPVRIYENFLGNYYYTEIRSSTFSTKLIAFIYTILTLLLFIFGSVFLIRKRKLPAAFYVYTLSTLFTIGYLVIIKATDPRYLLPLLGFVFLAFYSIIEVKKLIQTSFIVTFILVIPLGIASLNSLSHFEKQPFLKSEIIKMIDVLEEKNIHYVFSRQPLLQWQLMFYSKENIITRYKGNADRYPKYVKQVNEALKNDTIKVAIIGYLEIGAGYKESNFININNLHLGYENPTKQTLINNGFEFEIEYP